VAKFSVIYDACVLYPAPLRDLLMHLALTDLFQARWTDQIHEEWINSLLSKRKDLDRTKLEQVKNLMDEHVRDAKVTDYEMLINSLKLPDKNDRHVLAAAIRCNADAIVTFNLKDFPAAALREYSIEAIHPDDFVNYQLDLSPSKVCGAIKRQRGALKNPAKTAEELIGILQRQQLPQTCLALKEYIEFL
jgi:predicted nucleic acid-binding protein